MLFSHVNSLDNLSQKHQVTVSMDEATAADAEAAGLKVKTKEFDGKTQFQTVFKSKYKPEILSADGKTKVDLDGGEIARGSLVSVQYKARDWQGPSGNTGVSYDLEKVQLIEGVSGAPVFEDATETLGGGDDFDDDIPM